MGRFTVPSEVLCVLVFTTTLCGCATSSATNSDDELPSGRETAHASAEATREATKGDREVVMYGSSIPTEDREQSNGEDAGGDEQPTAPPTTDPPETGSPNSTEPSEPAEPDASTQFIFIREGSGAEENGPPALEFTRLENFGTTASLTGRVRTILAALRSPPTAGSDPEPKPDWDPTVIQLVRLQGDPDKGVTLEALAPTPDDVAVALVRLQDHPTIGDVQLDYVQRNSGEDVTWRVHFRFVDLRDTAPDTSTK